MAGSASDSRLACSSAGIRNGAVSFPVRVYNPLFRQSTTSLLDGLAVEVLTATGKLPVRLGRSGAGAHWLPVVPQPRCCPGIQHCPRGIQYRKGMPGFRSIHRQGGLAGQRLYCLRVERFYWQEAGIDFATQRKKNFLSGNSFPGYVAKKHNRKLVETATSEITARFPTRIRAVTRAGFEFKLFLFAMAFSLLKYFAP